MKSRTTHARGGTLASIAIGDTDGALNSVAVVATDPIAVEPVFSGWPGSPAVCTFHRAGNV